MKLHYLGPEGSFTHQAALEAQKSIKGYFDKNVELTPENTATDIFTAIETQDGWGVVALESNVEGYVVPNLDALIDANDAAGLMRITVNIQFNAFVRADHEELTHAVAHPHGLAQCTSYVREHNLQTFPADSNASACRDITKNQVAFGPALCGELYGLQTLDHDVQDFAGAHTDFLVIAPREDVMAVMASLRSSSSSQTPAAENTTIRDFETVIAFIPLFTGPGVLANLLDVFRDGGLSMTSFISRPIKGHDGTYSFVATFDAAPWEDGFPNALREIIEHGDWVKTLAVYPRIERPAPPVSEWMLPQGGVRPGSTAETINAKDLLW